MQNRALRRDHKVALLVCAASLFVPVIGAATPAASENEAARSTPTAGVAEPEILQLKHQLADEQRQIEELRVALQEQQKIVDRLSGTFAQNSVPEPQGRKLGEVASITPVVPAASGAAAPAPARAQSVEDAEKASPLQFRIGSAYLTPFGFMDFTTLYRSTDVGSSIGTNFGGIPFSNTPAGKLSETRLSAQNSRIGLRADARVNGANVLGYLESDFLGFAPTNASVTSNSMSLRLRQYWVDVRKDKWELMGGQSWSMLTPNRRGISPLPGDLFYSQDVDTNYQVGLTWSRDPGLRLVYHPNDTLSWGFALEHAEQYVGGSGGSGVVTYPAALATAYAKQLNDGTTTTAVPNLYPAVISKVAFDPRVNGRLMHFEFAGVLSSVKVYNPLNKNPYTATGGGGSFNFNLELAERFHLVANNYYSDGGGRWLFGLAPDTIIGANGRPSLIHSGSSVDGFEYQATANTQIYAYYGGIYIQRNTAIDVGGKPVGYGFSGSPGNQNRSLHEATFGLNQTFWKDPKVGALSLLTQYSYLTRSPWSIATGNPSTADTHMVFVNLRYTLPGAPPKVE